MTDLTKGSALKQIVSFAIPYFIGNLFQQFYNIVDMVVVGRTLGPIAYTAVGATGNLVWFAIGAVNMLMTGFSIITAQHFGAGNSERVKQSFGAAIRLSAVIAILASVFFALNTRGLLELMQTPDDIIDRAYSYLVWMFGGMAATALYNLVSCMLHALGDSKTPLYFLIVSCVLNVIFDIVFIVFCGMDTDGAGLATVLAQLISGLCCVVYIIKKHPALHISLRHLGWDRFMDRALLRIGIPMAFLNMVLSFGGIVAQFVTNGFGTLYVMATSTGSKIQSFIFLPVSSVSSAASVFAAQNYGARNYLRIIEGGRKSMLICYAFNAVTLAILLPFCGFFAKLLAGDIEETVVDNTYRMVIILAAFSFLVSILFVSKAILQAVGHTTVAVVSGVAEIVARIAVSILAVVLVNAAVADADFGYILVCLSTPAAWIFGLAVLMFVYIKVMREFKRLAAESSVEAEET